jgi:hypothetical protein
MILHRQVFLGFLLWLCAFGTVFAQPGVRVSLDLPGLQEYRFLSTTRTSTFEKELNERAAEGYRFVRMAKAFNDIGLGALLMRPQTSAEASQEAAKFEYKVIATKVALQIPLDATRKDYAK